MPACLSALSSGTCFGACLALWPRCSAEPLSTSGAALPPFVRGELEGLLDCGLLCRGFARLKCESCAEEHLVDLLAKDAASVPRAWAPGCAKPPSISPSMCCRRCLSGSGSSRCRTRCARAVRLRPAAARRSQAPVRGLHPRLVSVALAHQQARARTECRARPRASSDVKLNPHLQAVFLDGLYIPGPDGTLEFRALPRLSTTDCADDLKSLAPASRVTSSEGASSPSTRMLVGTCWRSPKSSPSITRHLRSSPPRRSL